MNHTMSQSQAALRRRKNKKGQTMVEYALILAFISVLSIGVLMALGVQITGLFQTVINQLATALAAVH